MNPVLVLADNSCCCLDEEHIGWALTQCISWLSEVLVLMKMKLKEAIELFASVKDYVIKSLLLCSGCCELFSLQDHGLCSPSDVTFLTTTKFLIVI